jgi:hypothetical protein
MALTRSDAESLLIALIGPLFTEVGLDGTTEDGSNADLNSPLYFGLGKVSVTVDDITLVGDADMARLASADYQEFLDWAELRCFENAFNAATTVDITLGPHSESLSQLADRLQHRIDKKREQVESDYGEGDTLLEAGEIDLDFAAQGDDDLS